MTWYTGTCRIMVMDLLLYKLSLWSKVYDYIMMSFRSNGSFVTGASCLNGGHGYDFANSMDYPRSGC
jgi:hypothetical protein